MANSYEIGQAYIGIVPSADGITGKIKNVMSPASEEAGKDAGRRITGGISSTLQSAGKSMIKAGVIATAISAPIIAGIKSTLKAYEQQLVNETKLIEIYKTRLGVSEDVARGTMDVAKALQAEGVAGDEVIIAGAQQVATYLHTADAVNEILPAMTDLIVQQNGYNASAGDAVNVANLVGKVMNGQVGALRRVGISFDKNQEYVLKYGTEEEKVAMLSEVITQNVGHMNNALADTPLGKIQQMKNSLGDMKEALGAQFAPIVAKVAEWVSAKLVPAIEKMIKFMSEHPIIAKMTVAFAGLLAVGGVLLTVLGSIAMSIGALIPVVTGISVPVLALIGWFAAGIALITTLYIKNEKFREACQKLANVIGSVLKVALGVLKSYFEALVKTLSAVYNAFVKVWNHLKEFGAYVKSRVGTPFKDAVDIIRNAVSTIKGFFPLSIGKILKNVKLPHFKVEGGKAPWGFGGLGKMPKVSVEWFAKGFMTKGVNLIGVGEAGTEALVPLDPFWRKLDKYGEQRGDVTINVYASEGMDVVELAKVVEQRLIQSTKRRTVAWQ